LSVREEFLELLRRDLAFREEVRRHLLTEDLLALPGRLGHLTELVGEALSLLRETVGVVRQLAEAQQRTEERLQRQGEQIQNLIEAQRRTEEQVGALFQAQQRTEGHFEALSQAQQQVGVRVGRVEKRLDRVEAALERLAEAQRRTEEQIQVLSQAQRRTEEALRWLVSWQRGEDGRRRGERYERETLRRAPALFNGGQGGTLEQPGVQQRLTEWLGALVARGPWDMEEDPFLADLLWWKGEQVAVVEVSVQVDGEDVARAGRRADILRQVGAQALAVVIGEAWAQEAREQALARQVEWKVGPDLSAGLLAFRRAPTE
jgi:hypothetical protein